MSANLKSNVLSRDEKGVFGIPFKRLIAGGIVGGFFYMVVDLFMPGSGVVAGIAAGLAAVILTGMRGGIPLWQRLILSSRGRMLLAAHRDSKSIWAQIARMLNLPVSKVRVDAAKMFAPVIEVQVDLSEWETFKSPDELEEGGLIFVDSPMKEPL